MHRNDHPLVRGAVCIRCHHRQAHHRRGHRRVILQRGRLMGSERESEFGAAAVEPARKALELAPPAIDAANEAVVVVLGYGSWWEKGEGESRVDGAQRWVGGHMRCI